MEGGVLTGFFHWVVLTIYDVSYTYEVVYSAA